MRGLRVLLAVMAMCALSANVFAQEDYAAKVEALVNVEKATLIELEQDVLRPVVFNVSGIGVITIDGKNEFDFKAGVTVISDLESGGKLNFKDLDIIGMSGKNACDAANKAETDAKVGLTVIGEAKVATKGCTIFGGSGGEGGMTKNGTYVSGGMGGAGLFVDYSTDPAVIPRNNQKVAELFIEEVVGGTGGAYLADDDSQFGAGKGGYGVKIDEGLVHSKRVFGGSGGISKGNHRAGDGGFPAWTKCLCGNVCWGDFSLVVGGNGGEAEVQGLGGRGSATFDMQNSSGNRINCSMLGYKGKDAASSQ